MPIDIQALKARVEELSAQVDDLLAILDFSELQREYETWYGQVRHIVSVHLPDRLPGLESLYFTPSTKYPPEADTAVYLGIRSYLRSSNSRFKGRFQSDLEQQRGILLAVPHIIELRALEVAALVTADLVQGELNEARLLLSHGFIRAAGAVTSVALEAHLKLLHNQSNLTYTDQDSIVPLATRLRQNNIISLGDEKKCIAMADTRNKCDHKKDEEPTKEEVEELISDVDRFTKRVQAT